MARFVTAVTPGRKRPTTFVNSRSGNEYRGTGRDQLIARDPEIVGWLTKVYGEKANGSRPWPEFDMKRLTGFLADCGVDLQGAVKDHKDSLRDIPESVREVETCIPKLKGASFLATSEDDACFKIRRRYETSAR